MTFCADGIVFVQDEVFVQSPSTQIQAGIIGGSDGTAYGHFLVRFFSESHIWL